MNRNRIIIGWIDGVLFWTFLYNAHLLFEKEEEFFCIWRSPDETMTEFMKRGTAATTLFP